MKRIREGQGDGDRQRSLFNLLSPSTSPWFCSTPGCPARRSAEHLLARPSSWKLTSPRAPTACAVPCPLPPILGPECVLAARSCAGPACAACTQLPSLHQHLQRGWDMQRHASGMSGQLRLQALGMLNIPLASFEEGTRAEGWMPSSI